MIFKTLQCNFNNDSLNIIVFMISHDYYNVVGTGMYYNILLPIWERY